MPRARADHSTGRDGALQAIAADLAADRSAIVALGYRALLPTNKAGDDVKLLVETNAARVKVEVNCVFRDTLLRVVRTRLTEVAQEFFTTDVEVPMLARSELYGSKLVAAMDRQHPRDMFDVMKMLDLLAGNLASSTASSRTWPGTTGPCTKCSSPGSCR